MSKMLDDIINKVKNNILLSKEDAINLLNIKNKSEDYKRLITESYNFAKSKFKNKSYVFIQIGLNSSPCSGNCKFCSLAKDNFCVGTESQKSEKEIITIVKQNVTDKIDSLFLMTTADYSIEKYLSIAEKVRKILPQKTNLVANIGDFDIETAKKLKETGFSGVYHIVRLGEGKDTDINPENRIKTLNAIRDSGLELIYCIEPIGPEHTYDMIADEMLRARDYHVNIMACMKRVAVKGTPLYEKGEIDSEELAKIVAVTNFTVNPQKSLNVHEPDLTAIKSGVNQLYAEIGINPRDTSTNTEKNRGYSVKEVQKIMIDNGFTE